MNTAGKLDTQIRDSALDLHKKDFIDIIDSKGDIYRFYLKNKEYEANDGIPPVAIKDAGKLGQFIDIFWMSLNFDELIKLDL
ncbi:hypothetical protein LCGC14_1008890 [marine sediment metagenome]|uniref:Uncharacterized protein n=1 Tax=marine sediment metagenome TaxID=412755 RepID=A0A0F9QJ53_9ZZZZ